MQKSLMFIAVASMLSFSAAYSADVCQQLDGVWKAEAEIIAPSVQCEYTGTVTIEGSDKFVATVDMKSTHCQNNIVQFNGTCKNGDIRINNSYLDLAGKIPPQASQFILSGKSAMFGAKVEIDLFK
jgi:hypothetical protein